MASSSSSTPATAATPAAAAEATIPFTPARRVMLVSIDGWGISAEAKGNAIAAARTPHMSSFTAAGSTHLHAQLDASGLSVGLPEGVMGNSEVGHLTMGCGRVDYQDLVRINMSIRDASFKTNPQTLAAINRAKNGNGRLHFLGLISDGGVHAHIDHLFEFLKLAKEQKVPETYVHFFADGRDTPPSSAVKYIEQLQKFLAELGYGVIGSIMGRYYAMDRDKRWDRVQIAYEALLAGKGAAETNATELVNAVKARYEAKETDEFLTPIIVDNKAIVRDDDSLVFINYRSDRMREIVEAVGVKPPFPTEVTRKNLGVWQMTQYNADFKHLPIIFPPVSMANVLAEWLSKHGVRQYHVAETEKYAHVTFFFNGGREAPFALEERELVASPKVKTYDLKPEMSATEVAERVVRALSTGNYPFVMCNFAPPDMVGHTGVYEQTVKAVETTDAAIGMVLDACQRYGYVLIVTADHGNAEEMLDSDGKPKTSHTTNYVPLNIAANPTDFPFKIARPLGGLADVAPTVCHIMGLDKPPQMTGTSMLATK